MNKVALALSIAQKSGLSKKDAEKALDAFLETIQETLRKDEKVQIFGFGAFEAKIRKERTGINPQNGEPMNIALARVPVFRAGKHFKEHLNS